MKFSSQRNLSFFFSGYGLNLLLLILVCIEMWGEPMDLLSISVMVLGLANVSFLLGRYFNTYYLVTDQHITYQSGWSKGQIRMNAIKEIRTNQFSFFPFPGVTRGGLLVRYNSYDELYLTPSSPEKFIAEITARNQQVVIRNH